MNEKRIIKSNTTGIKAREILNGVIGQMSDGMFENSRYYEGYWNFVTIDEENNICVDKRSYKETPWFSYVNNKFYRMSDQEVKEFFAKMIKKIIQQELRDNGIAVRGQFKKGNKFHTVYLNYYETITIDDCVDVYNALLKI